MSCRDYESAAEAMPKAFGFAKSRVSRRFIKSSARTLEALKGRRLEDRKWLVLFLDGKSFARDQLLIALAVTRTGEKTDPGSRPDSHGEHERSFAPTHDLLIVLDGAKGLRAAVRDVFGDDTPVQRCQ